jgi:hypothetical protein
MDGMVYNDYQYCQTDKLTRLSDRLSVSETLVFVGGPAAAAASDLPGWNAACKWVANEAVFA